MADRGRLARAIVRACSLIVPSSHRDEWLAEWNSEIWYGFDAAERRGCTGVRATLEITVRATGVLVHALWLLHNEWRLDMIAQDLSYAVRTTLKRPAFTTLVVGMLAFGIGANTAMFTVVNSVLLQPLPYTHASELVAMNGSFSKSDEAAISGPDFLDYRAQNRVFSSFAGYQSGEAVLTGGDTPQRVVAWRVTADFFKVLNVAPMMGRTFLPEEEEGAGHDVAIVSYGLWQRRFGSDPKIVGTTMNISGQPTQIVGVMAPLLDRTFTVDVWRPFAFHTPATSVRRFHGMRGVARLAPGVTLAQAKSAMDVVAKRLEATYPENATWRLRLRPYQELIVGDADRSLIILLGAVGLVLLIACGNVASLLLARATSRRAEIGIRAALGASRTRIIRQLITESLTLSAAGGALGLAFAVFLVHWIHAFGAGLVPRLAEVSIDLRVLGFTVLVSLLTGLVFGIAPALHAARIDVAATFAAVGRSSSGRASVLTRDALVVAQVAFSLVLLVGAGLMMRSLWALQNVPQGFDSDHLLTAQIALPPAKYPDRASQLRFMTSLLGGVKSAPGVTAASATTMLPMLGGGDTYFWRADRPPTQDSDRRNGMVALVGDDYFETMHIPLVAGRTFGAPERAIDGGANAIIINKRLAGQLFDNENPVGKRLVVDFGTPFDGEIVGVVGDVRSNGPSRNPPGTLYFSVHQPSAGFGANFFTLVARTSGDPTVATPTFRAALESLDRDIPLARLQPMQQIVDDATSDTRLAARLLGGFALVAMLLAAIGLYGVLTYAVVQRSRELAIRIAFGARTTQVFTMVLGRGMAIVGTGIAIGLIGAFAATRLLTTMLFQVQRTDPLVFGFVAMTLLATGVVACVIPASRATRVDPVNALRGD